MKPSDKRLGQILTEKAYNLNLTPIYYIVGMDTVCVLVDMGTVPVARGVAILSVHDQQNKYVGRSLSLRRALRAYKQQTDSDEVRRVNYSNFRFKSMYLPKLHRNERALLEKLCPRPLL